MKIAKIIVVLITSVYFLSGCASLSGVSQPQVPAQHIAGVYHSVERGQTLWKISRMYGVELEEITQANRLADISTIEVGQKIFIPSKTKPQIQDVKYGEGDEFIWPLKGRVIANFGQSVNFIINKGINIQPYGSIDVLASRAGRVVFSSDDFIGFGKTIIIDHGDGLFTVYARNSSTFVKAGDNVGKGAVISRAGKGGRDKSTYLHFEVRKGHVPQNPLFYLP